jgi:hypothetical protein
MLYFGTINQRKSLIAAAFLTVPIKKKDKTTKSILK